MIEKYKKNKDDGLGNYYLERSADDNGEFSLSNPAQLRVPTKDDTGDITWEPYTLYNKAVVNPSFGGPASGMYFGDRLEDHSRHDKDIVAPSALESGWTIDQLRAEQQSGFNKIVSGILKAGVLGMTTFAEGTIGLPISIANAAASAIAGENVLKGFIDTPFSRLMKQVNDWSEEALPNYYTKEEQNRPWWENIFTANFIGDHVLKTTGFTIGAALAGKVNAGAVARMMSLNKARNAFEGMVVLGKDGKPLTSVAQKAAAYLNDPTALAGSITDELANAAKLLKRAEPVLKWSGAITGSIGEAKIEAINNSSDHFDKEIANIEAAMPELAKNVMMDLAKKHPEHFKLVQSDFNRYDWAPVTEGGMQMLEKETTAIKNKAIAKLTQDKIKYANNTFLLNAALLSLTDYFTFGKIYSGGYNTGALRKKGLAIIDKKTGELIGKTPSKFMKGVMLAQTPIREGPIEEMMQSTIAEMSAQKYGSEINDLLKIRIDPDATEETLSYVDAMGRAFANTYGKAEAWEEGAIGALIGALGLPALRKSQRNLKSIPMQGGIWEQIAAIKDSKRIADEIISPMNNFIKSAEDKERKTELLQTVIGLNATESAKQKALSEKDKKAYKDAENLQLFILMQHFKAGGQLQMFLDRLDSISDVNEKNVGQYREMLASNDNFYATASDQEIIKKITKNAEETKKKLLEYSKVADDLQIQVGDNFSIEGMSTLAYMAVQMKDWDTRSVELVNTLKDIADKYPDVFDNERGQQFVEALHGNKLFDTEQANNILNTLSIMGNVDTSDMLNEFLKSQEGELLRESLSDLISLRKNRSEFINSYFEFINNPTRLEGKLQESQKNIEKQIKIQQYNKTFEGLSQTATVRDIAEAVGEALGQNPTQDDITSFLDALMDSDVHQDIKTTAQRYRNLVKTQFSLMTRLEAMEIEDQVREKVRQLIMAAVNNTMNHVLVLNQASYNPALVSQDKEEQEKIMVALRDLLDSVKNVQQNSVEEGPVVDDEETPMPNVDPDEWEKVHGIQSIDDQDFSIIEEIARQEESMPEYIPVPEEDELIPIDPNEIEAAEALAVTPIPDQEIAAMEQAPDYIPQSEGDEPMPIDESADIGGLDAPSPEGSIDEKVSFDDNSAAVSYDDMASPSPRPEKENTPVETDSLAERFREAVAKLDDEVPIHSKENDEPSRYIGVTDPVQPIAQEAENLAVQSAGNNVWLAIPEYDPEGFKNKTGKNKVFKRWNETLDPNSYRLVPGLGISEKDAYHIYEYLFKKGAFNVVNNLTWKTGENGNRFFVGYDANLKFSDGRVVPLLFAEFEENGKMIAYPINIVKEPVGKLRGDNSILINAYLDLINDHFNSNYPKEGLYIVNNKFPLYASKVFDGEIVYGDENYNTSSIHKANTFGYIKNGKVYIFNKSGSSSIAENVKLSPAIKEKNGIHVLLVQAADGSFIATPLYTKPLALMTQFGYAGEKNLKGNIAYDLDILKGNPLGRELYEIAKKIITAKSSEEFDRYFEKLNDILIVNFKSKTNKDGFFWDKTRVSYTKDKQGNNRLVSRFDGATYFKSYVNVIVSNNPDMTAEVDERGNLKMSDDLVDTLVYNMLFAGKNGLISNTDPTINDTPFTRLRINGDPQSVTEVQESIAQIKDSTFTNVMLGVTVRRNFELYIPQIPPKPTNNMNDNNIPFGNDSSVKETRNGQFIYHNNKVKYTITETGHISWEGKVASDEVDDLLDTITAKEFFKENPNAKEHIIGNKIFTITKNGRVMQRPLSKENLRPQPKTQKKSSGVVLEIATILDGLQGGNAGMTELSPQTKKQNPIISYDEVMADKSITLDDIQKRTKTQEEFDELICDLTFEFAEKNETSTITFEEFLEKRQTGEDLSCFGII